MDNEFTYTSAQLAHPGKRYQGQFIDGIVCLILFGLMIYLTKSLGYKGGQTDLAIIGLPFAYFVFSDAFPNGQSIGKKILNLSVISKSSGKTCTIVQSILRNLFTPILGILDAALILTKSRQRLGDIMANTIVVKKS